MKFQQYRDKKRANKLQLSIKDLTSSLSFVDTSGGGEKKSASVRIGQLNRKQSTDLQLHTDGYGFAPYNR